MPCYKVSNDLGFGRKAGVVMYTEWEDFVKTARREELDRSWYNVNCVFGAYIFPVKVVRGRSFRLSRFLTFLAFRILHVLPPTFPLQHLAGTKPLKEKDTATTCPKRVCDLNCCRYCRYHFPRHCPH